MKKISCSLIALLATTTVAFANTTPIDQLSYTTSNNEVTITGFAPHANVSDLNIPATINGNPVTTIAEMSFQFLNTITSITLPDSIQTIENRAFRHCDALTSLTLSANLQTIGSEAFNGCTALSSHVILPDSLQSIESRAFQSCSSIPSITLPASLQSIGNEPFYRCLSLTNLTVDANNSSFKSINNVLFNKSGTELHQYALGLTASSYTAPNNVETISDGAFSGSSLQSITLPDSVHTIGNYVFQGCRSLTSVTLPNNLQSIGYFAFADCRSLTSLTLPDPVESIGISTFDGCTSLSSLTLSSSLKTISNRALYNCPELTSLTVPASVTSIGNEVFAFCSKLESITFLSSTPPTVGSTIFHRVAPSAIVYVHPSATGFGATFEGLPVENFETDDPPTIQAIAYQNGNLLITLNEGTSGITVEETADITTDNWTPISPTIDNGAFQLPTTHTHRYFRFTN